MIKKNSKYLIILIIILFISIGYAYLSSNLSIGGIANVKQVKWNIYFDNVVETEGEKFATLHPATTGNNTTSLNYEVALEDPGDSYSFNVDVVNDGNIDAMINLINIGELSDEQKKVIDYYVTYSDGTPISAKNFLPKYSKDTFKVVVNFKRDIQIEELPSEDKEINLSLRVEYTQAKDADSIRDDAVKSRTVKDLSGKGNYAIMSKDLVMSTDGTVTLDGVDDLINIGLDNHDFNSNVSLVIRTRFNQIISDRDQEFFGNWESAGLGFYLTAEGKISFSILTGNVYDHFRTNYVVNTTDFYTIVFTYDGTKMKIYVNGVAQGKNDNPSELEYALTGSIKVSALPLYVGANPNSWYPGFQFPAAITVDDVLVYDRALTSEEISVNYNGKIDSNAISFDKLISYYDFKN